MAGQLSLPVHRELVLPGLQMPSRSWSTWTWEQPLASIVAPAAARHMVLLDWTTSVGQAGEVPVHDSAWSQPPATAARHTVVAGLKRSSGQALLLPSQDSATSQAPGSPAATARHTVPKAFL